MNEELPISSAEHPRLGWEEGFKPMAVQGDDILLDEGEI
jgi:hypothetical protein